MPIDITLKMKYLIDVKENHKWDEKQDAQS